MWNSLETWSDSTAVWYGVGFLYGKKGVIQEHGTYIRILLRILVLVCLSIVKLLLVDCRIKIHTN